MQKIAESLHIGRSLGALAAAAALASALAGCKPDSEPEHPYGKVPAKPVVATPDTGPKAPPTEADAKAGEPDAQAAQAADAKAPSGDAKAPAADVQAADAGAAGAAGGPDGSGSAAGADLSARFYSLVGLRLVGRGDAGLQRWLFKQNGFFERELHGEDKSVTLWSGTWKLDGDALALTYKETLRGATEGAAATATEGTVRLPVGAVGKLKLSIGGVTVAVDLDE